MCSMIALTACVCSCTARRVTFARTEALQFIDTAPLGSPPLLAVLVKIFKVAFVMVFG